MGEGEGDQGRGRRVTVVGVNAAYLSFDILYDKYGAIEFN